MEPVTGPNGSNRGFIIDKFYNLKENIDFQKFVSFYLTNAKDGVKKEAIDSLYPLRSGERRGSSCSNLCVELKNEFDKSKIIEKCISDNSETRILVARLKSPYHVILQRAAIGVK